MTEQKTFYFGAGWFNDKQNKAYNDAMNALKANKTANLNDSYVPLEKQYKVMRVYEQQ